METARLKPDTVWRFDLGSDTKLVGLTHANTSKCQNTGCPNKMPSIDHCENDLRMTPPFTGPRRTTLIAESARPAAPCAKDRYTASSRHGTTPPGIRDGKRSLLFEAFEQRFAIVVTCELCFGIRDADECQKINVT